MPRRSHGLLLQRRDRLAAKAQVAACEDGGVLAKAGANGGDDLLQRLQRAVAAIAVRRAQLRPQWDVAAESSERGSQPQAARRAKAP